MADMRNGDTLVFVDVFNGYDGGPSYGAAWDAVHMIVIDAPRPMTGEEA